MGGGGIQWMECCWMDVKSAMDPYCRQYKIIVCFFYPWPTAQLPNQDVSRDDDQTQYWCCPDTQFFFLFYYTDFGQITCTLRDILYLLLQIFFASICPLPHIFFTLSCFAPINSHVISTKGHGNMIGSMCQGSHNMPENMLHAPKHVYITWGYSKVKKYGTKGRLGKKLQQYSLVLAALTTIMLVLFTTYLDSTLVAS